MSTGSTLVDSRMKLATARYRDLHAKLIVVFLGVGVRARPGLIELVLSNSLYSRGQHAAVGGA
jgi:hypothetical protein